MKNINHRTVLLHKINHRTVLFHKITQAVILAGGAGTRLQPFTDSNPKPMIPINGKPFLEHLIYLLRENNIKEVVILTGYMADKINAFFGDGSSFGIKIKYSYTPFLNEKGQENKSGMRIKNAEKLLDKSFLLLYCDNYWPLKIKKLIDFFNQHPSDALVTLYSNKDKSTRNNMLIKDGYIIKYNSSRTAKKLNCVDIGFFIINKTVLKYLPKSNVKFEDTVLPKLVQKKRLSGYLSDQKYYSIGNLEKVKITEKFLSPKKVIFLDRDGVINKRPPKADYVKSWEEFEFLPGSIKAIELLNHLGYQIFIITNQPGIARDMLTVKKLDDIHKKMVAVLKKSVAEIDGIYYCPHGWNDNCICRKPKPGLLYQASQEHFIDLTKAIFIGDDKRDKIAGDTAGCTTILINKKRNLLDIVNSLNEK